MPPLPLIKWPLPRVRFLCPLPAMVGLSKPHPIDASSAWIVYISLDGDPGPDHKPGHDVGRCSQLRHCDADGLSKI